MLLLMVLFTGEAGAQSEPTDEPIVQGTLTVRDSEGEKVPVPDVEVTVSDSGGEIGSAVSDKDGAYQIPVPLDGANERQVSVTLNEDSLPEGLSLKNPDRNPLQIQVREQAGGRAVFALNDAAVANTDDNSGITVRRVLQLSAEGIKLGLILALAAMGLSLIFGTTGLVNFAHGEMVTWGALVAYFFNAYGLAGLFGFLSGGPALIGSGGNLVFAATISLIICFATGMALDRLIFRRLRNRGIGLTAQLVITIGLSMAIRYSFLYVFRGDPRSFKDWAVQKGVEIGPITLAPKDLWTIGISLVVLIAAGLLLQRTRIGKAMRAVADNRDLAASSGINVERVIILVWGYGAALAALAGILFGLGESIRWDMGFRLLLMVFAAVTLGGLGTAFGALVGSLVVGVFIQLSTLFISPELKTVGALLILVLILVARPQGILGQKERIG
ncbi:MAG: branched-chain amino acid ABC transporter permease [Acidimicrobiia bacterium]|nr:branched-chain amino acid ABC transporter permease [Acidimicrobiia bacterium]